MAGETDDDIRDMARMLFLTGRAVDPNKWVDELMDAAIARENESQMKLLFG